MLYDEVSDGDVSCWVNVPGKHLVNEPLRIVVLISIMSFEATFLLFSSFVIALKERVFTIL